VFGRTISSDFPLDRLAAASSDGCVAVTIRDSGRLWLDGGKLDTARARFLREPFDGGVRYLAGGVGAFVIAPGGRTITYSLAPDAPAGDVQHILTGPALVMALQLQGDFFLHGAAIEHDGAMFALSAPHGFGKSTLTAAFYRAGDRVHSDDVVPIKAEGDRFTGGQGQPWIKLWDSALDQFGDDPEAYDEVLKGFGKRIVPGITAEGEFPLGAVYFLAPSTNPDIRTEFASLSPLNGALGLMSNVYSPEIIKGDLAARSLDFATRVAETVPVRVVSYFRSFEGLPALREAILRDFDEVRRG